MIEGLKPYPSYTDTGLPWLGQIPATWKLRRAKYLFREVDERSRTGSEELLSVSHKTGVTPRSQKNVTMFMAESNVGHKVCRPDDLVINTLWAWMSALGVSRHHGIVSPAYGVYRPIDPSGFRPRFADQLLRTPFYAAEYQRCSTGVNSSRLRLYPEAFFRIPIMLPPKEEQEAIVRFLAHANHKIDGFIRAKRKLIGLLNEQKQAIIHQAVTRGLDPSVPIQTTGNRWFPRLPQGWEVVTMRRVIHSTIDGPHFSPKYLRSGVPFLSSRNVRPDRWLLENAKFISEADYKEFCRRVRPEKGDVLFTKGGTTGVAKVVDLDFPFQVWVHIAVLKLDRALVTPEFLAFCLNSPRCYEQSQLFTRGATNQDLGLGRMKQIELPLPPSLDEQNSIVASVTEKMGAFSNAIARTEREIALMQEYRTRLTADLVTGKLDVREAARKLPEVSDLASEETAEEVDENELDSDSEPE